jgi:hypothetical protein
VQLLLIQSATDAHVCGQPVSRFFSIGMKWFGRVIMTCSAAKAALFVGPTRILHEVTAFKIRVRYRNRTNSN